MISKKLLLGGIAAGAIGLASQASALVIAASTTGAAGADTSVTTIGSGTTSDGGFTAAHPYLLAQELNYTRGVTSTQGQFSTDVKIGQTLTNNATFSISITYSGATLNGNSAAGDLTFKDGTGANLMVASGSTTGPTQVTANGSTGQGNSGSSTATYTFTTGSASTIAFINIAPPIIVKNGGNVTMTVSLTDGSGNTFSPTATAQLITASQGFKLIIGSDNVPTFATATGGAGPYQTLATGSGADAVIGTVSLSTNNIPGTTNGIVYEDLNGTVLNPTNAISSENITVFGDFSALNVTGNNGAVFGAPVNGTEFTSFAGPQTATGTSPNFSAVETISVAKNNIANAISPTAFNATASVVLNNTTFGGSTIESSPNGALQTVNRQGYTAIVPWVASATQAGATGATSTIRVSSINSSAMAGAGGDVFAELINGLNGTRTGIAYMGTLVSGGEVVISSQNLENAFGNFTRGDIRITVDSAGSTFGGTTAQPSGIIIKRLIVRPSGITEMLNLNEAGTVLDLNTTVPSTVPPSH